MRSEQGAVRNVAYTNGEANNGQIQIKRNARMKEILETLDKIDFHDLPVTSIQIQSEKETEVAVSFLLYLEGLDDYRKMEMVFREISSLEMGNMFLDSKSEIEIYGFDYEFRDAFYCKMTFLSGSGPGFEMAVKCKQIVMNTFSVNV